MHAQVSSCTKNMNTFGFVGDLNGSPEVSCVYHSEEVSGFFHWSSLQQACG